MALLATAGRPLPTLRDDHARVAEQAMAAGASGAVGLRWNAEADDYVLTL